MKVKVICVAALAGMVLLSGVAGADQTAQPVAMGDVTLVEEKVAEEETTGVSLNHRRERGRHERRYERGRRERRHERGRHERRHERGRHERRHEFRHERW